MMNVKVENIKNNTEGILQTVIVKEEYILPDEGEGEEVTPNVNNGINEFPTQTKCERVDWSTLTWICQFCDQRCYGYKSLKFHMNSLHQGIEMVHIHNKCIECGEIFNSYLLFTHHARTAHYESLKLCCDVCSENFSNYKQLSKHRERHLEEYDTINPVVHYCFSCEEMFSFKEELRDHFVNMHSSDWNSDDDSGNFSESKIECRNNEPKLKCDELSELPRAKVKRYECSECKKKLSTMASLKEHQRGHTDERPYKCKVCEKYFRKPGHLKDHKRVHTGERPYKCAVCGKDFQTQGNLKTHVDIHMGERKHKCEICEKSFSQLANLKLHMRIHSAESPYKCMACEKYFQTQRGLQLHSDVHESERPYTCEMCPKSFAQPENLKRHERVHTVERLYKCEVCSKAFPRPAKLKRHMLVHTGERSFQCKICGKLFSQHGSLKRHFRAVHIGDRPFRCEVCLAAFKHAKDMKVHLQKQHPKEDLK